MSDQLDLARLASLLSTDFVGRKAFYREATTSTMEDAEREAAAGAPEGAIALADEQSAGRGRSGRSWVSPPAVNIYVTIILHPSLEELRHLAVIAPLAVCQAIEETTGLQPRIKWPNDVLIEGKKVCGILCESEISGNAVQYAVVGIGVNVNFDPREHEEVRDIATSLKGELGRQVGREEILAAVLDHFEALYLAVRRREVVSMGWKHRLDTLGKPVKVLTPGGLQQGVAVEADSDGSLILRLDDGSHVRVEAGEILPRE